MKKIKDKTIRGFSKLAKADKIKWISDTFFSSSEEAVHIFEQFSHKPSEVQKIFESFSENTIANYILPYGVAPNFIINDITHCVPMVIEESSVVAAASSAAKFWMSRGGFHYEIHDVEKLGQIHFFWEGDTKKLIHLFDTEIKQALLTKIIPFVSNMEKRGGGIRSIELLDKTGEIDHYYQLLIKFDTCDSMGANFINTILEECLKEMRHIFSSRPHLKDGPQPDFLMAILSNYTPNCKVRAWVKCKLSELDQAYKPVDGIEFANRFFKAVQIAKIDKFRAVTHNKGIFNGIDAVVIATGNDFRAVEACGHAFAAESGAYKSLSDCRIEGEDFVFSLELPLALGTVGGITCLHPLTKKSLGMLGNPTARELMGIAACAGLAQNFGAIRSLITTGIQYGHMKMHLDNILNHLNASEKEIELALSHFNNRGVSFTAVRNFLEEIRNS
nr:hydroxymethylglutaryl-CoA reductase [Saprospiraceae bacterium]